MFSVKTPSIKRELRSKDKELREEMGEEVTQQEVNEAIYTLKKARKNKEKNGY